MNTGVSSKSRQVNLRSCDFPNIFVGGIPSELSASDILDYLANFGHVGLFEMPRDPVTFKCKGYAKAHIRNHHGFEALRSQKAHWIKGFNIGIKPWVEKSEYLTFKDELNKRKLFVKFSPLMNEQKLYNYFSQFGPLASIECKRDPQTNKPRNFGYVVFDQEMDANAAALNGNLFSRKQMIWCELTTPKFILDKQGKETRQEDLMRSQRNQTSCTRKKQARNSKMDAHHAFKVTMASLNEKKCIASLGTEDNLESSSSIVSLQAFEPRKKVSRQPRKQKPGQQGLLQKSSLKNDRAHKKEEHRRQPESSIQERRQVGWMLCSQDHHLKPTSKRYPLSSLYRIADNHSSGQNLHFRVYNPVL